MSTHLRAQLLRFGRISILAFVGQLATTGEASLGWKTVGALAAGAVETGIREVWPVNPIPAASPPPPGTAGS